MNAIVGYSEESVEDVQARIKARDENRDRGSRGSRRPRDVEGAPPPAAAVSALDQLVAQAKATQQDPD